MSTRETLRLDLVSRVCTNQLDFKSVQRMLNVSERTLRRYICAFRKRGVLFIKHGNCKRVPYNRISNDLKGRVQELVKTKYFDFNMLHTIEKLKECEGIEIKRETLRRWCHEIKMVKRKKRRQRKYVYRDRMQAEGMMLQMDGSHHRWFNNQESCLIAAIDDATSDVPYAEFFLSEDTISCMRVLQKIVESKGLFQVLYVDRAGIFGGRKRHYFAQAKRALAELGIQVIFANTPQAKGRIERLFGTLQDRIVPELRSRGIKSYPRANSYLQNVFLPYVYQQKFRVRPQSTVSAYKKPPTGLDLNEVFCLKEHRRVKADQRLSWNGVEYLVEHPEGISLYKQYVELRTYQDLTWKALYANIPVKLTEIRKVVKIWEEPTEEQDDRIAG